MVEVRHGHERYTVLRLTTPRTSKQKTCTHLFEWHCEFFHLFSKFLTTFQSFVKVSELHRFNCPVSIHLLKAWHNLLPVMSVPFVHIFNSMVGFQVFEDRSHQPLRFSAGSGVAARSCDKENTNPFGSNEKSPPKKRAAEKMGVRSPLLDITPQTKSVREKGKTKKMVKKEAQPERPLARPSFMVSSRAIR